MGVVGTAVLTGKATVKAKEILAEATKEKGSELTAIEKIKAAGPVYIPSVLMGAGTITCIVSSQIINQQHQASLTNAYFLLNQSYKQYRNKVKELYGEDADSDVEEMLARDNCTPDNRLHLFYDEFSDRFFESTLYKVQRAEYELNRNMLKRDYAYLNEWYEELDIDIVEHGYDLGWSTFQCMEMYWQPWIDFDHYHYTLEDGRECTGICIVQQPVLDFADWY